MATEKYINIHQPLIDLCCKGDTRAQFELYQLYSKAMYNTCYRIVGHRAEAEDVLQEAFFKAFSRISTYENRVSFGAWLKRIVVNTSLDYLKKAKVEQIPLQHALHATENEEYDPDFVPQSVEELLWAMDRLPRGYQTVVSLYYFEEFSHEEIGELMGISPSTSRSQLTRAKQQLYRLIRTKQETINHG